MPAVVQQLEPKFFFFPWHIYVNEVDRHLHNILLSHDLVAPGSTRVKTTLIPSQSQVATERGRCRGIAIALNIRKTN